MTTQEIYTLANETTENQLNNLLNGFNTKEENSFNTLVRLGDRKEVEVSEIYNLAYKS